MTISVKRLVRTHGALVSAVTAASVGVAIVVQSLAQTLVGWVGILGQVDGNSGNPVGYALSSSLLTAIPFAIGFFLSLWLVAPIAEELRVGHVITRAVLATGIGATLVFIVLAVLAITGAFSVTGTLFGNTFPGPVFDGGLAAGSLGRALSSAVLTFVGLLPLGVLAGVLLWVWRKDHPPKHPLAGMIDL